MTPPRSDGFVRMPDAEFEAILTRVVAEAVPQLTMEGDVEDVIGAGRTFAGRDIGPTSREV